MSAMPEDYVPMTQEKRESLYREAFTQAAKNGERYVLVFESLSVDGLGDSIFEFKTANDEHAMINLLGSRSNLQSDNLRELISKTSGKNGQIRSHTYDGLVKIMDTRNAFDEQAKNDPLSYPAKRMSELYNSCAQYHNEVYKWHMRPFWQKLFIPSPIMG